MDIEAAFKKLSSETNNSTENLSIEDAFQALVKNYDSSDSSEAMEPAPPTQPSEAIPFSEPVEGANSEDPASLDVASENSGFSFVADDEDEDLPSDYEVCDECGFDHGYEPHEAQMAHAEIQELNFDD